MNSVGSGAICPIFSISAVTGEGIDVLRKFLYLLPMSNVRNQIIFEENQKTEEEPKEEKMDYTKLVHTKFIVDSRYFCKNVGLVLGGTVLKGNLKIG